MNDTEEKEFVEGIIKNIAEAANEGETEIISLLINITINTLISYDLCQDCYIAVLTDLIKDLPDELKTDHSLLEHTEITKH